MGCRSDYLDPDNREIEGSRVATLLDELQGKKFNKSFFQGFHPDIYNQRFDLDKLTAQLCANLQTVDVTKFSLEMQIWWRDHQEADRKRAERKVKKARTEEEKAAALAKLTPHERKLLGL